MRTSRELTQYEKGYLDGLIAGFRGGRVPGLEWHLAYKYAAEKYLRSIGLEGWTVVARPVSTVVTVQDEKATWSASEIQVAALYVETGGVYFGLPDVDPWDETRDARLYAGPWPVVAHPPCRNWSILSNCRPEIIRGEDGGCFGAALQAVREFGGVLEHPRHSGAWEAYGLPYASRGGWTQSFTDPGVVTEVDQGNYGHPNVKPTWLYFVGPEPPPLQWMRSDQPTYRAKRIGGGGKNGRSRPDHSRTPAAFRDVLLDMARSAAKVPA